MLQQAAERQLDFIGARRLSYLLAFVQGDSATMARELEASTRRARDERGVRLAGAHVGRSEGASATAHEQFRRGIQMSLQGSFSEVAAQLTMEDAETHAIVGQCAQARSEVRRGVALSRDNVTLERASRVLALCGAGDEASTLSSELAQAVSRGDADRAAGAPDHRRGRSRSSGATRRARSSSWSRSRQYDHAPSAEFWPRLPARPGLPPAEGRAGGRRGVPEHPRSPRRGAGLDAVSAGPSRARARHRGPPTSTRPRAGRTTTFSALEGRRRGRCSR